MGADRRRAAQVRARARGHMGRGRRHLDDVAERRRSDAPVVPAARTGLPEPGCGARPHPHELAGRHPPSASDGSVPDTRHSPQRRSRLAARGGPIRRGEDPRRTIRRAERGRSHAGHKPRRHSTRSRSSLRECAQLLRRIGSSPRFSSPTSSGRPSEWRPLATLLGRRSSDPTTMQYVVSSSASPARRSTPPATASSRSSTVLLGPFAALSRFAKRCVYSGST